MGVIWHWLFGTHRRTAITLGVAFTVVTASLLAVVALLGLLLGGRHG